MERVMRLLDAGAHPELSNYLEAQTAQWGYTVERIRDWHHLMEFRELGQRILLGAQLSGLPRYPAAVFDVLLRGNTKLCCWLPTEALNPWRDSLRLLDPEVRARVVLIGGEISAEWITEWLDAQGPEADITNADWDTFSTGEPTTLLDATGRGAALTWLDTLYSRFRGISEGRPGLVIDAEWGIGRATQHLWDGVWDYPLYHFRSLTVRPVEPGLSVIPAPAPWDIAPGLPEERRLREVLGDATCWQLWFVGRSWQGPPGAWALARISRGAVVVPESIRLAEHIDGVLGSLGRERHWWALPEAGMEDDSKRRLRTWFGDRGWGWLDAQAGSSERTENGEGGHRLWKSAFGIPKGWMNRNGRRPSKT